MLDCAITYIQGISKRFEHLLLWPPRSPDLTPCDIFLWGYVKDNAYKPPLPQNVHELQDHIRAAVQTIEGEHAEARLAGEIIVLTFAE